MLDRANYVKSNQSYNRITDEYRESSSRDLAIVGAAYAHIFSHTQLVGQAGVPPMDKEVCVWIDVDALGLSNFFVWLDSRLFSDKRPNESLAKHTHIFTLFAGVWRIPKERERDRERQRKIQQCANHKQTQAGNQARRTNSKNNKPFISLSHLSSLISLCFSLVLSLICPGLYTASDKSFRFKRLPRFPRLRGWCFSCFRRIRF